MSATERYYDDDDEANAVERVRERAGGVVTVSVVVVALVILAFEYASLSETWTLPLAVSGMVGSIVVAALKW